MKSKMKILASLKIWVVIYPSLTLLLYLFGRPLAALPLYQRTFLLTITLVPWIMFIAVPALESLLAMLTGRKNQLKQSA